MMDVNVCVCHCVHAESHNQSFTLLDASSIELFGQQAFCCSVKVLVSLYEKEQKKRTSIYTPSPILHKRADMFVPTVWGGMQDPPNSHTMTSERTRPDVAEECSTGSLWN